MAKKSFKAKLVGFILTQGSKKKYDKPKEKLRKEFMQEKEDGEKEYIFPHHLKLKSNIKKEKFQQYDIYILSPKETFTQTIFYFHGGGYVHRPQKSHWKFVDQIVNENHVQVIFPIYPLAPFHTYLDMYEMMVPYYLQYLEKEKNQKIIFMGDSAGGGFALSFYQYLLNQNKPIPQETIVFSPWVDLQSNHPDMDKIEKKEVMLAKNSLQVWGELWAKKENLTHYMVSPTFYDHLERMNHIHIFVGTDEILYPDIYMFYQKIKNSNVKPNQQNIELIVGERMNHVYPLYPIPEAKHSKEIIAKILKKNLEDKYEI